jgi:hypothetical protein
MHFMPSHAHGRWRAVRQANAVAVNGGHNDRDLPSNDDLFLDATTEHSHGIPSMIPGTASFPVGLHVHCLINAKLGPRLAQSGRTAISCREPRGDRYQDIPDVFPLRSLTASITAGVCSSE